MQTDDFFISEMSSIRRMLYEKRIDEIIELRQTKTFATLLEQNSTEVISSISSFLDDKYLCQCFEIVECCRELFSVIVEKVDAEDCFISFLEQFDECECSLEKFCILLIPLRLLLEKLATSRGHWLDWALNTVQSYLDAIQPPADHVVEFDEKKMLAEDPYVDGIIDAADKLLSFYESFDGSGLGRRETDALIAFGFRLLDKPLIHVYAEKFPTLTRTSQRIVARVDRLTCRVHYLLDSLDERHMTNALFDENDARLAECDFESEKALNLEERISALQLAAYYFHKVPPADAFQIFPFVYDRLYLFHKLLYLSVILSQHAHNAVARKGLLLGERALAALDDGCIPSRYLELRLHQAFVVVAGKLSVYAYIYENRQLAIQLLLTYLRKFDAEGAYQLYANAPYAVDSADVKGEIVTSFRRRLYEAFVRDRLERYHRGKLLVDLLKSFCRLRQPDARADLTKELNLVLSTLHLFALILGRDADNRTGVRDHFAWFERHYFDALKTAVTRARETLRKETHALANAGDDSAARVDGEAINVVVQGETLPPPKTKEKIEAVGMALTSLDMIERALDLVYEYANR